MFEAKPIWDEIPAPLVRAIESRFGKIKSTQPVAGGFSNAMTSRVEFESEECVFLKASHPRMSVHTKRMLEVELRNLQNCSNIQEFSPKLLHDVSCDGWTALIFEWISNRVNLLPWSEGKVQSVLEILARLHAKELAAPRFEYKPDWRWLFSNPEHLKMCAAALGPLTQTRAWFEMHKHKILDLEASAPSELGHHSATHMDLRSDNILLAPTPMKNQSGGSNPRWQVRLVDWSALAMGSALLDLGFFALSVESENGPSANQVMEFYSQVRRQTFTQSARASAAVSICGYYARRFYLPALADSPEFRQHQKIQMRYAMPWMAQALEIEPL